MDNLSNKVLSVNENGHPYRWFLHVLVSFAYLMGFCVRFSWPTLTPYFITGFSFTNAQIGSYMSAFYIGYVFTQAPAGYLCDKFGVKNVLTVSLIIQAVSIIFLPSILNNYYGGFALRVISGLGTGVVYGTCIKSVVTFFPDKEKNIAFGFLMATPFLGVMVSNLILPYLMGYFSWQQTFRLVGYFTILVAFLIFIFIKNTSQTEEIKATFLEGVKFVFSQKPIVFFAISNFFLLWAMVGFISWGNIYFTDINYTPKTAANIMLVFGVFGIVGAFLSGILAAKTNYIKHMFMVNIAFATMAICFLLFAKATNLYLLMFFVVLLGLGIGGISNLSLVLIAHFAGKKWAGVAGGITGCFFQTASIISPYLLGKIVDWQNGAYTAVWWCLTAACVLGIFFMLLAGTIAKRSLNLTNNLLK